VAASQHACPPPPPDASLVAVPAADAYGGKAMRLRATALAAYERMVATARAEDRVLRRETQLLTIFSAYRDPESDAARCAREAIARASSAPPARPIAPAWRSISI